MRISQHAKKRMKQRCGLHGKSAVRMGNRVLEEGIRREYTKGRLRKWIDWVCSYNPQTIPVLYGEKCYIFSECNVLITILNVPSDLTKDLKHMVNHPEKRDPSR